MASSSIQAVEDEEWLISIKRQLDEEDLQWQVDSNPCIFTIPEIIKVVEPRAFTPQIVSIGPYHRGREHLQEMEKNKWRLLQRVVRESELQIERFVNDMKMIEQKTRDSYYQLDDNKLSSKEFVEMMVLDACFVLEILNVSINWSRSCPWFSNDPMFNSRSFSPFIQRDLLMLENQLPLQVLQTFLNTLNSSSRTEIALDIELNELVLNYFRMVIPGLRREQGAVHLHILDFIHGSLLPNRTSHVVTPQHDGDSSSPREQNSTLNNFNQRRITMHCASRLEESGIKIVRGDTARFMDIEFNGGVLYISQLEVHRSTQAIFLNLMAFEQCYPGCSNRVTAYMNFMGGLINTSRDVELLKEKGIIHHTLGSDKKVANLFNNFCNEMACDTYDEQLQMVSDNINTYFDKKWNRWIAQLKRNYLKDPWVTLSVAAASLLLLHAFAQTTFAVLSYFHSRF